MLDANASCCAIVLTAIFLYVIFFLFEWLYNTQLLLDWKRKGKHSLNGLCSSLPEMQTFNTWSVNLTPLPVIMYIVSHTVAPVAHVG